MLAAEQVKTFDPQGEQIELSKKDPAGHPGTQSDPSMTRGPLSVTLGRSNTLESGLEREGSTCWQRDEPS